MDDELIRIRVNDLGEFIRFRSCGRRFKLAVNNRAEAKALPFAERLFNALDPVLQSVGQEAEDHWQQSLLDAGFEQLHSPGGTPTSTWAEFAQSLSYLAPNQAAFGREIEISGSEGAFAISGRMDFVVVRWDGNGPKLRIVEGKASRKDRTYQRLQLAAYKLLLQSELAARPLSIAGQQYGPEIVEGVVVRIDENTNEPQEVLTLPPLGLHTELADVQRLLAYDGILNLLACTATDDVDFQLDAKCDSCVFSVHCFPESARQRRFELLGINPGHSRILRTAGVATIDDLASLDPAGELASTLKRTDGFDIDLAQLIALAKARSATLPGGDGTPDEYPVQSLPRSGTGQLPPHEVAGAALVRVYLQVDYDYTQNRIGALAAHVTSSDHLMHTPFERWTDDAGVERSRPSATVVERVRTNPGQTPAEYDERPWGVLAGRDVIFSKAVPWTGDFHQDATAEEELLEQFFRALIVAINEVAVSTQSALHFYVFSRSEMTQLVEACARTNSRLLTALRELLGCREGLEQLLFSCVQDEVNDRYALGWTGRGLSVMTSLPWFGARYHWRRRVGREDVSLDQVFEQDIFDFKSTLSVLASGEWGDEQNGTPQRFEIRARFHDSLPAPYWRAAWGTLPSPDSPSITDQRVKSALRRYLRAAPVGYLEGYLTARVHALRWLEERITFKNLELAKPTVDVTALRQFALGVEDAGRAAIDFLLLDHHVKRTDWLANGLRPVSARVYAGRTIPLRDVRAVDDATIVGTLDLDAFGVAPADFAARCDLGEGSYARITPRGPDPETGQTLGQLSRIGATAEITEIDWETGEVTFDLRPMFQPNGYVLRSSAPEQVWTHAAVDDSVSDFVANRVEGRLRSVAGHHALRWFDPTGPQIPVLPAPPPAITAAIEATLEQWEPPQGVGNARLAPDQLAAVRDGLATRVQLLKGPPGTGKTATTAASILARISVSLPPQGIVLVAANTHLAVDTVLNRLAQHEPSFRMAAAAHGVEVPPLSIGRIDPKESPAAPIEAVNSTACAQYVRQRTAQGAVVLGGTTTGILKLATQLSRAAQFRDGFAADVLIVDEASMMVFPHFLALASLLKPGGQIMLAGDNRQLAPIVAHDWETEDRPPVQVYQPFRSAYDAVERIVDEAGLPATAASQSALTFTFRLPEGIRRLIALVYARDGITLQGQPPAEPTSGQLPMVGGWSDVWNGDELTLIVHDERQSRKQNVVESEIIRQVLAANDELEADSVAIITPHKSQRQLLRRELNDAYGAIASVIDTVERLQGGERANIIVSATRSDPHAIGAAASFILNLNRANVAFSRTKAKLIVVCSQSLLDHVPPEIEDYETAMLWKSLRTLCTQPMFAINVNGTTVRALSPGA
ncbi:MAG: AAA domain-containing protein [Caulobacter sp.]|nr:AAA domain-containing protein [Caulobacter sp.]